MYLVENYYSVDTIETAMLFVYLDLKSNHLAASVLDCRTGLHLCTAKPFNLYTFFFLLVFVLIVFLCSSN